MNSQISVFTPADTDAVNQVALSAFRQYEHEYKDWATLSARVRNMAALADSAELMVAKVRDRIAGAVAYVGPGKEKAPFFAIEWPVLRMLVVDPALRGMGIGRALTEECIRRAIRDEAPLIALHTSHIMAVALAMYQRMGFRFERAAPDICGAPYRVYVLELTEESSKTSVEPVR